MNIALKTLEQIGQNSSIKEYTSLDDMVSKLSIQKGIFNNITISKLDFMCILVPADDTEESDNEDSDSEE